jgi:uncharacterized membrane protein
MSLLKSARGDRRENERGVTLILVAITLTAFIAASAFSVDLGRTIVVNRSLQSVADSTAITAARYTDIIDKMQPAPATAYLATQARNAVTENGSAAQVTVTGGVWGLKNGVVQFTIQPCGIEFPPYATPCNAVKVTASSALAGLFHHGTSTLSRSAVGFENPEAGFSIGTYLASFSSTQSAILNDMLDTLGPGGISLTAVGYDGLATSYVSVQQLINASGGVLTPTNVLTTSLSGAQWNQYLTSALGTQIASVSCTGSTPPPACAGHAALMGLAPFISGSTSVTLCNLVSINGSTCETQLSQTAMTASIDVLQTLTTEAEVADGTNAVNLNGDLNILGVTSATITTSLISKPAIAYGPINTTASTGQVNAVLALNVAGLGVVNVQVTAATGTATLSSVTCTGNSLTQTLINARTTGATLTPTFAGLSLSPVTLTGAVASPSFIAAHVPPSFASIPSATNPTPTNPNPWTFGTESPSVTLGSSDLILGPVFALLDPVIAPVLESLGVMLAGAQVADLSTGCGAVSLVQ